ncbi:MAG: tripartite tricarboxylate transporter substrate-binding protein [Pigmentiphaga sp.]|nr:tripartite tricarboxylate transporter substrate-binding protein [Pigmentiphaga sp.]
MKRRTVLQMLAAAGLAPLAAVRAGPDDGKPLNLLVGFAPGSVPDIVARVVGKHLSEHLHRPAIVENRGGVGGQLALSALKQAPANVAPFALTPLAALTLYPLTYANLPYDVATDLVPVCSVFAIDFALAVAADHPAQTLQEFVDWCKANPGKASIGNPGSGSSPHFVAWAFDAEAGLNAQHVPYRSPPQIANEVVGGTLAAGMASVPLFAELIKGGRLRVLATTGAERNTFYPQIPTFIEAGYPSVVGREWFCLVAPAGTPRAEIEALTAAMREMSKNEEAKATLALLGFTLEVNDAAWVSERMREEAEYWRRIVERTGFKAQ